MNNRLVTSIRRGYLSGSSVKALRTERVVKGSKSSKLYHNVCMTCSYLYPSGNSSTAPNVPASFAYHPDRGLVDFFIWRAGRVANAGGTPFIPK